MTIPKADLEHGAYYEGACRNALVARWDANTQRFYHWREKWGGRFVEDICCPEDDGHYDVFTATAKIPPPTGDDAIPIKGQP